MLEHLTIDSLSRLDRASFMVAVGAVFEHSPWVMERAWERRPFANRAALLEVLRTVLAEADRGELLALINAHPELAGIGYVPQGREIFPRLTVEENLLMGLATKPGGTKIPDRIFEMFPVLKQMMHRRGGDLSGGQQQQLAIGRALAMGPKLLILDEPTEGIQPSIIKDIERAIRMLAATGEMAILLVEQYYDFAEALADQYLLMERGEFIMRGRGETMPQDGVRQALAV